MGIHSLSGHVDACHGAGSNNQWCLRPEMVTFMSRTGPNTMEGNQQKTEMYGNVTLWLFNVAMENHHF